MTAEIPWSVEVDDVFESVGARSNRLRILSVTESEAKAILLRSQKPTTIKVKTLRRSYRLVERPGPLAAGG